MKKRMLFIVLILIGIMPVFSQQEYDNENDFRIIPLGNGMARITGYIGTKQAIRIPPRIHGLIVTEIGDEVFTEPVPPNSDSIYRSKGKEIISIIIPNTVTSIGKYAFFGNLLTSVIIPDSVTSVGEGAFLNNKLTSITIPNSITYISGSAFQENQLNSITIPNSVTSIGDWAFGNNQLASVIIPDSVTSIGECAFANNKLTSVTIPNSVTSMGDAAFLGEENMLTRVTIGANVTLISQGPDVDAFFGVHRFFDFYNSQGRREGTFEFRDYNGSSDR